MNVRSYHLISLSGTIRASQSQHVGLQQHVSFLFIPHITPSLWSQSLAPRMLPMFVHEDYCSIVCIHWVHTVYRSQIRRWEAWSVDQEVLLPESLENILRSLGSDLSFTMPATSCHFNIFSVLQSAAMACMIPAQQHGNDKIKMRNMMTYASIINLSEIIPTCTQ